MIDQLESLDQQITLFLNGFHSSFMDQVMWVITYQYTWVPLYILLLYFLIKHYPKDWWLWLIGIVLLITATDQFTSSLLKPWIGRLRPCHDPEISPLIHNYKKCGGLYSFVSGHSANSFAVATFFFLLLKDRLRFIGLLFLYATVVAYSRVYLGVHYLGDILVGGMIGSLFAMAFLKLVKLTSQKMGK